MISRYKAIIWDWNGTLFNDVALCLESINALLEIHEMPEQSMEAYREHFSFPVIDYYEHIGFDLDRYDFKQLGAQFMDYYEQRRDRCSLYEGVAKMLEAIRSEGLLQFVLSAYRHTDLVDALNKYDIAHYFESIYGHHDIYAPGKTENAQQLINVISLPRDNVLMIGDTLHDAEIARELDVDCILMDHGYQATSRLNSSGFQIYSDYTSLCAALFANH